MTGDDMRATARSLGEALRDEPETLAKALALVDDIHTALASGTRHYNRSGDLLATPEAILKTLIDEGGVTFSPASSRVEVYVDARGAVRPKR